MEIKKIAKGAFLAYHTADRFKTTVLSLSVLAPLDEQTTCRALLLQLLARTTKQYPTTLAMNRRLASLYGATITPTIHKQGEIQVLSLVLSCVDDRFALDNESICQAGVELLCDCLLLPDLTPDGFKEENVAREKQLLKQKIDSEKDDKRLYAMQRMIEKMCQDEPFRRNKYGNKAELDAIDGKQLFACWKDLMLHAQVMVSFVGSTKPEVILDTLKARLGTVEKTELPELRTEFLTESYDTHIVKETQDVKQGKLVIGYRAGMTYDMDNYAAIRLMTSIFGGGTFSKLFQNVREKMSLCYYCSARLLRSKGLIVVESGVETENAVKALDAIRHELDDIRAGNFSDETLAQAKRALSDGLLSVTDSNMTTLSWLEGFSVSGTFYTPEQIVELLQNVSREEVILAANLISEDTVFILESEKKEA